MGLGKCNNRNDVQFLRQDVDPTECMGLGLTCWSSTVVFQFSCDIMIKDSHLVVVDFCMAVLIFFFIIIFIFLLLSFEGNDEENWLVIML